MALVETSRASKAEPFVIQLGPGVFHLTSKLVLRNFVSLVGAGPESTRLILDNSEIRMGGDVSIRNLAIEGMRSSSESYVTGTGERLAMSRVRFFTSTPNGAGWVVSFESRTGTIDTSEFTINGGGSTVISSSGEELSVRDSSFVISDSSGYSVVSADGAVSVRDTSIEVAGEGIGVSGWGRTEVVGSTIRISGHGIGVEIGSNGSVDRASIRGSTIEVVGEGSRFGWPDAIAVRAAYAPIPFSLPIESSRLSAPIAAVVAPGSSLRFGGSKVDGEVQGADVRCAASYDGEFRPLNDDCTVTPP